MKVGSTLLAYAIDKFSHEVLGNGVAWASAKRIVLELENKDVSHEQKFQDAVAELKSLGYGLATFALHGAIMLAVMFLRAQAGVPFQLGADILEQLESGSSKESQSISTADVGSMESVLNIQS